MKKIFTLRFILVSLFAAMSLAMNAEIIYTNGIFKYKLDTETKTAELLKYDGSEKEVVIPEIYTYYKENFTIISLSKRCFYECSSYVTSVKIESVK